MLSSILMFTGIIEHLGMIESLSLEGDGGLVTIHAPTLGTEVAVSNSIAVNGCCLTIVSAENDRFSADLSGETIHKTSFGAGSGALKKGSRVNLEQPLTAGKEFGGHFVLGHVDATSPVPSTWPSTKWPPNSLPAESGCSRFTRAPFFSAPLLAPKEVLRIVSPERSAEKRSFSAETMVRQQPLTAMLLATARLEASVGAWMVTRPPSFCSGKDSTVPRCSMIPVNIEISRIASRIENARSSRRTASIWSVAGRQARLPHSKGAARSVLHLAVNVLEIGLDRYVLAELLNAQVRQWRLRCG